MEQIINQNPIRVAIIEASFKLRMAIKNTLAKDNNISVIYDYEHTQDILEIIIANNIEVLLLDANLPSLPEVITLLLRNIFKLKILVLAEKYKLKAPEILATLPLGVYDIIEKSEEDSLENNEIIIEKIKTIGFLNRKIISDNNCEIIIERKNSKISAIAIASSTGGPKALMELFSKFDASYLSSVPVFITQHIPANFTKTLANNIANLGVKCVEAIDGEVVRKGVIYLAPGGVHMLIEEKNEEIVIKLTNDPPENFCRPSADPMLRSIAKIYKNPLLIVLTGMGKDGLDGAKHIVDAGGDVIAQDEETSVVWGMPGAVANNNLCVAILPLPKIAAYIMEKYK